MEQSSKLRLFGIFLCVGLAVKDVPKNSWTRAAKPWADTSSDSWIYSWRKASYKGGKGQNWKSINVKRKQTGFSEHGRKKTATYQETGLEEHSNMCVCVCVSDVTWQADRKRKEHSNWVNTHGEQTAKKIEETHPGNWKHFLKGTAVNTGLFFISLCKGFTQRMIQKKLFGSGDKCLLLSFVTSQRKFFPRKQVTFQSFRYFFFIIK